MTRSGIGRPNLIIPEPKAQDQQGKGRAKAERTEHGEELAAGTDFRWMPYPSACSPAPRTPGVRQVVHRNLQLRKAAGQAGTILIAEWKVGALHGPEEALGGVCDEREGVSGKVVAEPEQASSPYSSTRTRAFERWSL